MPQFSVSGTSRKGRKVARVITAQTVDGARRIAEQDGVTVENVDRLPPEPATERQLSYARSLDIAIPVSPSLDEMSNLISRAVEPPASEWLVARARALEADIDPERYPGVEYFSRQLNGVIGVNTSAFDRERVFWYLHSVLRHRRKGPWSSPDKSGVVDGAMWAIVEAFIEDAAAFKSMQRDCHDRLLYQYVEFGDGYGGTLSIRTTAYKRAVELLTSANLL